MRITKFVVLLLMSGLSGSLLAQTTAGQIREATLKFLDEFATEQASAGYKVAYESGSIDSRVALAECESPLTVEFSGDPWKSTSPTLQVSCEGNRPWRMFVTASVSIHGPALVATRPLTRGERITADLVTHQPVEINASRRGAITETQEAVGMEVRRSINAGALITPDMLSAPAAVERGDHVIITARSGGFSVSSRGKALASAGIGEQVLVENLRSSRTVKGNVVGPGHVEIPM
ncbi:flagellar basal body P-ring formation chaperone FlgA [Marinobacter subterrani]|uniref:Flagella basal body P-ring formation protein FlgA n=1 Tax=Marinobacter subterrani TaxID=1658765 RepID=A0A0J7J6W3_9GAMM|nr:flagellar basal body P-ring formation chaperone FlgA [Marinobacter subterrani]KMQ74258.1 flagella basal body P-ring formation protein FlgA [Marinobacter subterrani]